MDRLHDRIRTRQLLRVLLYAAFSIAVPGCGARSTPEARLCLDILKRRSPAAQVLAIAAEPENQRATISYRVKGASLTSRLACEFQAIETGGLRVRSVAVDGQPLLEAELAVIDADLLFNDMRRGAAAGKQFQSGTSSRPSAN
jgi:hypothetical protein